jgi:glycosyltransferase involved in cell wall biosynthesis
MKVLFFIDCLTAGGKERRLSELMKVLLTIPDFEFELAVMHDDIHYKEILETDVKVHKLIRKRKKDLFLFVKLYKLCSRFKPDIIHCWDSMTAIYSIPVCKLLKIKLVNGMVTDALMKQNIFNKLWIRSKLAFIFSDIIVGNSKAGLDAYSAPVKKRVLILNGFNFDRLTTTINPEIIRHQIKVNTKYIVGMVANFSKNKDYQTYFSAAQILLNKRDDITFLAIGHLTDSSSSKQLIKANYLENFRLLGHKMGIESLVNVMDVCVLSTYTEGISNAILEYMALGKPVVATVGGGTNEILVDQETGYLVSPSNPKELAMKIEFLLNNLELRFIMGDAGRRRIHEIFSIETMVNKYLTVYKNILQ